MALWDKVVDKAKHELIDIVEWIDQSNDTMVHRFERYQNEIKFGAQLIVRESQVAVFVNMGQIADVFVPGQYTLETKNLPVLSTLQGWKYGFNSPFKCEVYFVSTRRFTDLKWGTKNPIMLRDAEFGAVRLRAFGTFEIKVSDAAVFIREIVGTDADFSKEKITEQLKNILVTRFADALGESKIPALDLAANYNELGDFVLQRIAEEYVKYGLELTKVLVENISLPPEVEQAMDKRTSMGVIGNLNAYTQFQAANAMEAAAKNPDGMASGGMGMGMGFAMAQQMGQAMMGGQQQQAQGAGAPTPPPVPGAAAWFVAVNGQQTGPYDQNALAAKIAGGELTRDSLIWKNGMAAWAAAGSVPEIAGLFGQTPPPVPPQG